MDVLWDTKRRYRAFYEASRGSISLVSSSVSDNVRGTTVGGVVLLVTDSAQRFLDLELSLDTFDGASVPISPLRPSIANCEVLTRISETVSVYGHYDSAQGVLQVHFGMLAPERWIEIDEGHLLLGLGRNEVLCVLHCPNVVVDPTARLQAQWIEQAEGDDGV